MGEDNEKPQNKEDDDWRLGLRATNEKITRRKQQDVNTETSGGDASNKVTNNNAPHRTNEHDSKEHGVVGTRGVGGITLGRINDDTNSRTTNEGRLVGSEDPKDKDHRSNTNNNYIKSLSEVNTKLNKKLNKLNMKQISNSDTRLGNHPAVFAATSRNLHSTLYARTSVS